ncbi:MAG: group II truncated hemoglobin [Oceanospirillaceae bacterium]|nr:group II truncated hemoglobin [Oceanospirillaceae bacterium]
MEYGVKDGSFQAAGGELGIFSLVEEFYCQMNSLEQAQKIRAMHPEDLTESIDKLASFLCGWLGGPKRYKEKYGSISIPRAHQHLKITPTEQHAWMLCMDKALQKTRYPKDFQEYLLIQLNIPASRCVNAQ